MKCFGIEEKETIIMMPIEEVVYNALRGIPCETLEGLKGKTQSKKWHPEGDAWNHSVKALLFITRELCGDTITVLSGHDLLLQVAMLYHDIGKTETAWEELPHHYHHDNKGYHKVIEGRVPELPVEMREAVASFCHNHMKKNVVNKKIMKVTMDDLLRFFTKDDLILLMRGDTITHENTSGTRWMEYYEV